jgi:hypothetical protein
MLDARFTSLFDYLTIRTRNCSGTPWRLLQRLPLRPRWPLSIRVLMHCRPTFVTHRAFRPQRTSEQSELPLAWELLQGRLHHPSIMTRTAWAECQREAAASVLPIELRVAHALRLEEACIVSPITQKSIATIRSLVDDLFTSTVLTEGDLPGSCNVLPCLAILAAWLSHCSLTHARSSLCSQPCNNSQESDCV